MISIRRRVLVLLCTALLAPSLWPAPAALASHDGGAEHGLLDRDPRTTERVPVGQPTPAAVEISRRRFGGGRAAAHVVLAREDTFADAVAGSALTGDGPLLLTASQRLPETTRAELARVLPAGRPVYLLGGTSAISEDVAAGLRADGYEVRRLAGETRIGTALAVADAVRALRGGDEVLLARAFGPASDATAAWADSVAAGAVAAERRLPILLTGSGSLDPAVAAWLRRDGTARTTLIGGTAALSAEVERAVPGARRVSGVERTATAAAIARQLWSAPAGGGRAFLVTNGRSDRGWAFGFAAAGAAADGDAPVLLVTDEVTPPTAGLVSTCGEPEVDLAVVGDGSVVPGALREQLDAADRYACGPGGAVVAPDDLAAFAACEPLLRHLKESALERVGPYGMGGVHRLGDAVPATGEAAPSADQGVRNDSGSSGTNIQEEGVEEPDILKTDGRHAYVATQERLEIVRVSSGTAEAVASLPLGRGSHELLLSGDRLLVLTRAWQSADGPRIASSMPAPGQATTTLTSVDVSRPDAPRVVSSLVVEGDYRSARAVGATARIVIQDGMPRLPFVHPDGPGQEAEHRAAERNRALIAGTTLEDWLPTYERRDAAGTTTASGPLLDCGDVHRPPLFSGFGTLSVLTLDLAGDLRPTSSAAVLAPGDNVYASPTRLFVSTGRWDWEPTGLGRGLTTEIHGFDIGDPRATRYVGSGSVPGYVLNQFSLSEHEGHLRVATTTEPPWRAAEPGESESSVHVLQERSGELVQVGHVGGLGRGERIYAVRYFGDLAAVVTFRQIDPLYLLDLSRPTAPQVTGELKIPGVSAYLHRVADDRLLGVGWDAGDDGRITGVQASLFDIGDRTAPRLLDRVAYPRGSTEITSDHHAFLHWPATSLAVLPLVTQGDRGPGFVGASALTVGRDTLREVARLTHVDHVGGDSWVPIRRSFVAAGGLFTVSAAGIESADLGSLTVRGWLPFPRA